MIDPNVIPWHANGLIIESTDKQSMFLSDDEALAIAKLIRKALWEKNGRCGVCGDYLSPNGCSGPPHLEEES